MQGRQKQIIESYQRVQAFLEVYPAPAPANYTEPKLALEEVLAELTSHSSAQVSGQQSSQAEKRRQDVAMRQLRDRHMRPIVRIAKFAISDPGTAKEFRMPTKNFGVVNLLSASEAMRKAAMPHQAVFVKNGLRDDFLERFVEAEAAITRTAVTRGKNVGRHVGASAGLADRLKRGREAVDALDSIVQVAFEGNAVVLAAWRVAKRVKGLPGGGRTATTDVTADTTADVKPAAA